MSRGARNGRKKERVEEQKDQHLGQLLVKGQEGDKVSYQMFLKECALELRPYLVSQLKGHEHVDDVLQEILISLHQARHTYLPERMVSPWLYAIAHNRVSDFYRRFRRIEKRESPLGEEIEKYLAAEVEGNNIDEKVLEALKGLPFPQGKIIEMLKLQEFSIKEIAEKMNMSEGAVKVSASRGYRALRSALGVSENEN